MRQFNSRALGAAAALLLITLPAQAQPPGGMRGMGPGMPGMMHDSATMALMVGSHALVMKHDQIKRTVTNLPNGVRTVTESDDPNVAALIKDHVTTAVRRTEQGDDPNLPMESPALRALFRAKDKVLTSSTTTAKGIIVVQTSDDPDVVAALHEHAAEVSALVEGGMSAMRASMAKRRPK
jgi:hypothetical protein